MARLERFSHQNQVVMSGITQAVDAPTPVIDPAIGKSFDLFSQKILGALVERAISLPLSVQI